MTQDQTFLEKLAAARSSATPDRHTIDTLAFALRSRADAFASWRDTKREIERRIALGIVVGGKHASLSDLPDNEDARIRAGFTERQTQLAERVEQVFTQSQYAKLPSDHRRGGGGWDGNGSGPDYRIVATLGRVIATDVAQQGKAFDWGLYKAIFAAAFQSNFHYVNSGFLQRVVQETFEQRLLPVLRENGIPVNQLASAAAR